MDGCIPYRNRLAHMRDEHYSVQQIEEACLVYAKSIQQLG